MKKRKVIRLVFIVGIFMIAYIIATSISIWNYSKVEEKQPADVAIVLGAGTADEEVTPVFQERINHGIWLYKNGYVKILIMTGGIGKGNNNSDAWVAKQYAMEQGIPESDVLLEEKSTITQENIENAKKIMEDNSYHTTIIVSDPLHMKRAMLMAEDYEIKAYSSPTSTSRYISLKSKLSFLAREEFFYVGYRFYRIFH